jgi:hypothetical protein
MVETGEQLVAGGVVAASDAAETAKGSGGAEAGAGVGCRLDGDERYLDRLMGADDDRRALVRGRGRRNGTKTKTGAYFTTCQEVWFWPLQ